MKDWYNPLLFLIFALCFLGGCELQAPVTVEQAGEPCAHGNEYGYCARHEYCNSEGICQKAGDYCETSSHNHNGFGFCLAGYACTQGECQLAKSTCSTDRDCESPLHCSNEVCVCGDKGGVCGDNQLCCLEDGGYCISFGDQTRMDSCGVCRPGYANCNKAWSDGCEVHVWGSDLNNCGDCDNACLEDELCLRGICGINGCLSDEIACVYNNRNYCLAKNLLPLINLIDCNACSRGYGDCNREIRDGCELRIDNNNEHCGGCNNQCATHKPCIDGKCTPSCTPTQSLCDLSASEKFCLDPVTSNMLNCNDCKAGFYNCNDNIEDGCELSSSAHHITACNTCAVGYVNCDSNWSNGCEVNLSANHLTACSTCAPGYVNCDNNWANGCEVNLSANHMTACNTCSPGYGNCDNNWSNGCEKNLSVVNMTACNTCSSGYGNCNGNWGDGCEVNLGAAHMSACGQCSPGYGNCNGNWGDGCEIFLLGNDFNNCGSCGRNCNDGNACTDGDRCSNGQCLSNPARTCPHQTCKHNGGCNPANGQCQYSNMGDGAASDGLRCCGGVGVNITNNASHCGGCWLACAAGFGCEAANTSNCAPAGVSGRCVCNGQNARCPTGAGGLRQICRLPAYPLVKDRCTPESARACASGQSIGNMNNGCSNYCRY